MKKPFTYILLNVLIYNEISKFSFGQEYPHMDQYYSNVGIEKTSCENLICDKSKLMVVQIKLLLASFNEKVSLFSGKGNISNAYKLHWNKFLAQIAQNKSGKCLPATYEKGSKKYSLYDKQTSKILGELSNSDIEFEAVIGERIKAEDMDSALFISNMIKDFATLFFSSEADLTSRASNKHFGCGYTYMENNNTVKDRLLCIFGFMHVGQNPFTLLHGRTCSECDTYYQKDLNSTSGMMISKNTTWGCDLSFPYLCTDANLIPETIDVGPYLPYCPTENSSTDLPIFQVDKNLAALPPLVDPEISEWPCLPIFLPLAILIIVFLILAVYHFATALKFRYDHT